MDILVRNRQQETLELLMLWEQQIIEVRLPKDECETKPYVDAIEQDSVTAETHAQQSMEKAAATVPFEQFETLPEAIVEKPEPKAAPQLSLF